MLLVADPSQQSLCREVTPDPMEGEQTWPTEQELEDGWLMCTLLRPLKVSCVLCCSHV